MPIRTWISGDLVYLSVETVNGGMITATDKRKFVTNFNKYSLKYPIVSKSKHGHTFARQAIEKCFKCKTWKPITDFNCYGSFKHPCFDCCDESKKKFDLPLEVWDDNFNVEKVVGKCRKKVIGENKVRVKNKKLEIKYIDTSTETEES